MNAAKAAVLPVLNRRLRALARLAAVTGVAVVLAAVALWQRASMGEPDFAAVKMFPTLKANVDQVATLQIETKSASFNIVRDAGGRWSVPDKAGYPADFDTVRKTLIGLADLNLIEQRTSRSDMHEKLGVALPKSGGTGTLVTLKDAKGEELASLVVGNAVEGAAAGGRQAVYVRRAADPQTYVARGNFSPPTEKTQWLSKTFVDLVRERVKTVDMKPFKGRPYAVTRDKASDQDFRIAQALPAGRVLRTPGEASGIGNALLGISFDDVKRRTDVDFKAAAEAVYKTFDGLTLSLKLVEVDREFWLTLNAAAEQQPAAPAPPADTTLKPDIVKEAQEINQRVNGWAYRIPRYKGTLLTAPLEDLLKPVGSP